MTKKDRLHELFGHQEPQDWRRQLERVFLAHVVEPPSDAEPEPQGLASVWFSLDIFGERHIFGPAPYPTEEPVTLPAEVGDHGFHIHDQLEPDAPPPGTLCSVFFDEGDPDRPYVLALYGWPD